MYKLRQVSTENSCMLIMKLSDIDVDNIHIRSNNSSGKEKYKTKIRILKARYQAISCISYKNIIKIKLFFRVAQF